MNLSIKIPFVYFFLIKIIPKKLIQLKKYQKPLIYRYFWGDYYLPDIKKKRYIIDTIVYITTIDYVEFHGIFIFRRLLVFFLTALLSHWLSVGNLDYYCLLAAHR